MFDLICFSHLRWNFVYQRPQHIMTRYSKLARVFFVEEPMYDAKEDFNQISRDEGSGVHIVVPHLSCGSINQNIRLKILLKSLVEAYSINDYLLWYYSPMALEFSDHLSPRMIVYDCMDELSAFKFAPASLNSLELKLFSKSDVVFTGGQMLYEAKKSRHHNIFPFPSSIDKDHFYKARANKKDPEDQKRISSPRLGFYGVIDERFDIDLINEVATIRPDWQFVMLGPVVKIDPATLPQKQNIHWLGSKTYNELPEYLSGWDICIIPFVLNESTRFISPTKTPEYLAAGKPVISTAINDVMNPYEKLGLVHIIRSPEEFVVTANKILNNHDRAKWLGMVDYYLAGISWDRTFSGMHSTIRTTMKKIEIADLANEENYV